MSGENVETVRLAYEALSNRGLDEFLACWADDLDHLVIRGAPDDRGPIHGRDAMRAYIEDWIETFDDFQIQPLELIDAGDERVVGILRFGGRAKLSGVATDQTFGTIFSIREGKIWQGREYATRVEALEAAGLSQ
jgi:ketosteroid isomerase-like protein